MIKYGFGPLAETLFSVSFADAESATWRVLVVGMADVNFQLGCSDSLPLFCKEGAEAINPESNAFMTDIDSAFMEQIFDVTKRKGKSEIHQDSELDDLGRRLEIAKGRFEHQATVGQGTSLL